MKVKVGKSKLKNKSKFPTAELVELTEFVLEFLECEHKLHIKVVNAREEEGLEANHRIKIWLPVGGWPRSGNTGKHGNFPHYLMRSWQEAYVVFLAHEVTHAMGQDSSRNGEWACEITACAALLTYRSL